MAWTDDVTLKLYISESGDFVSLGTRTPVPFTPASGGIPAGFNLWYPQGMTDNSINFTTASGRFSISRNTALDPNVTINRIFGAAWNFNPVVNKRYIMNVQVQQMEGKSNANRVVRNSRTVSGTAWEVNSLASTPWETVSLFSDFTSNPGFDIFSVMLGAMNTDPLSLTWGVQYQNLSIIEIDINPPVPVWHEVTCDIRSLSVREGRERTTSRYEVATASLGIINDSGEFSYQPDHPWGLRPGRFLKVEATYNGSTFPVFYGVIDGMENGYTLDGHALTTMQCVDVSSLLANQTVPGMSNQTTMQLSGVRFRQILNGMAWHPAYTDTSDGVFLQQGITANGRTVRDELGLMSDSEGSFFWADRTGKLFYRGRDWAADRITKVGAEILAQPATDPIEYPYVRFVFPGAVSNFMDTPHVPAFSITGDIDIRARFGCDVWTGPQQSIVGHWNTGGFQWLFNKAAGTTRLNLNAGNLSRSSNADLIGPVNGRVYWFRATYTQSTGVFRFYWAGDTADGNEPQIWTQIGTDVAGVAGSAAAASTATLSVGANGNGVSPFAGRIANVTVRVGATIVFAMTELDAYGKKFATSFTANTGQLMTVRQTVGQFVIIRDATVYVALPVVDNIPDLPSRKIVCANQFGTSWSRDRIVNELSLANRGGSAFTIIDSESQKKFGPKTYQRFDFLNDNSHPEYLLARADDIMSGYTDAIGRVNSVTLNPDVNDAWVWLLVLFMNDLVRVRYTHPTEGWGFAAVAHVQGIEHSIDTKRWSTRIALDDYEAYSYWADAPGETGWDVGDWDVELWDGGLVGKWTNHQNWSDPNTVWGK